MRFRVANGVTKTVGVVARWFKHVLKHGRQFKRIQRLTVLGFLFNVVSDLRVLFLSQWKSTESASSAAGVDVLHDISPTFIAHIVYAC